MLAIGRNVARNMIARLKMSLPYLLGQGYGCAED